LPESLRAGAIVVVDLVDSTLRFYPEMIKQLIDDPGPQISQTMAIRPDDAPKTPAEQTTQLHLLSTGLRRSRMATARIALNI
jgi:hypothetical protein